MQGSCLVTLLNLCVILIRYVLQVQHALSLPASREEGRDGVAALLGLANATQTREGRRRWNAHLVPSKQHGLPHKQPPVLPPGRYPVDLIHSTYLCQHLNVVSQVDVIESQCAVLHDKIAKTQDFETIRFAHDSFLNALLAQSFLLTKPVSFHFNLSFQRSSMSTTNIEVAVFLGQPLFASNHGTVSSALQRHAEHK